MRLDWHRAGVEVWLYYSQPRHWMDVGVERRDLAALQPGKHDTHLTVAWVGPITAVDSCGKEGIFRSHQGSNREPFSLIWFLTDYAISTPDILVVSVIGMVAILH
jgi:hypothetical protein